LKEVLKRNVGNEWSVYIAECSDGTLYTGYTNNVFRRITKHNTGSGAKYTRGRLPLKLVHYETYPTKSDALKREAKIKSLSREEKVKYINGCGSK